MKIKIKIQNLLILIDKFILADNLESMSKDILGHSASFYPLARENKSRAVILAHDKSGSVVLLIVFRLLLQLSF